MSNGRRQHDRETVRQAIRDLTPDERERLVAALAEVMITALRERKHRDELRRLGS